MDAASEGADLALQIVAVKIGPLAKAHHAAKARGLAH